MKIINISNLKFNIKTYSTSFKKENVTSSISNANNFSLYDRALSNYNQINFMGRVSISKEELQDYISKHPEQNQEEIGRYFHVTGVTIGNMIRRYEIKYTPHTKIYVCSISEKELKDYIEEHPEQTQEEIAQYFNVSKTTIHNLNKRYGIKYQHHAGIYTSSVSKKELESYIKKHPKQNQREIAEHFNVTGTTIGNLIKKYGIEYVAQNTPHATEKELSEYIKKHPKTSLREIGEALNISSSTAYKLLKKFNMEYQTCYKHYVSEKELRNYIKKHPEQNQEEIGEHFNVVAGTIRYLIRKYGIEYQPHYKKRMPEKNKVVA